MRDEQLAFIKTHFQAHSIDTNYCRVVVSLLRPFYSFFLTYTDPTSLIYRKVLFAFFPLFSLSFLFTFKMIIF